MGARASAENAGASVDKAATAIAIAIVDDHGVGGGGGGGDDDDDDDEKESIDGMLTPIFEKHCLTQRGGLACLPVCLHACPRARPLARFEYSGVESSRVDSTQLNQTGVPTQCNCICPFVILCARGATEGTKYGSHSSAMARNLHQQPSVQRTAAPPPSPPPTENCLVGVGRMRAG